MGEVDAADCTAVQTAAKKPCQKAYTDSIAAITTPTELQFCDHLNVLVPCLVAAAGGGCDSNPENLKVESAQVELQKTKKCLTNANCILGAKKTAADCAVACGTLTQAITTKQIGTGKCAPAAYVCKAKDGKCVTPKKVSAASSSSMSAVLFATMLGASLSTMA